jgi:hypothetical protein
MFSLTPGSRSSVIKIKLLGQSAQQFLVKAFAVFIAEIEGRGEIKLHGVGGDRPE